MNKIYYIHGTMFSGKSLDLISTYTIYKYNNKKVVVLKPSEDTRDKGVIKSRMSDMEVPCITFSNNDNIIEVFYDAVRECGKFNAPDVLLIDEVQFLTPGQVKQLIYIATWCPVMCYGLKNSYTGELFPAIATLLSLADDVREVKTTCRCCNKKATHNILIRNGKPIYEGAFVNIEGDNVEDKYYPVCKEHFYIPEVMEVK